MPKQQLTSIVRWWFLTLILMLWNSSLISKKALCQTIFSHSSCKILLRCCHRRQWSTLYKGLNIRELLPWFRWSYLERVNCKMIKWAECYLHVCFLVDCIGLKLWQCLRPSMVSHRTKFFSCLRPSYKEHMEKESRIGSPWIGNTSNRTTLSSSSTWNFSLSPKS